MISATFRSGRSEKPGSGRTGSGPICVETSKFAPSSHPVSPRIMRQLPPRAAARRERGRLFMVAHSHTVTIDHGAAEPVGYDHEKHRHRRQGQTIGDDGGPPIAGMDEVVDE